MSLAELVITSVTVEGRTKSEVARDYHVSRYWVHLLVKRFEAEGETAFVPRSKRPHGNSRAVDTELEERVVRLRKQLSKKGWDAGADTIRTHLQREGRQRVPSVSTIWRILNRRQTQKKWLAAQPPAQNLQQLQRQLDRFRGYYNTVRPHRAIGRRTPAAAYTARPKTKPAGPRIQPHYRVRRDRVDTKGVITLRYDSRLRHIGLGREHARKRVLALIADRYIRVVDYETGELLRDLTLDPDRDYQPLGRPPGPPPGHQPIAPPAADVKTGRRPPAGHRP